MKKDKLESASKIETANCADAQGKAQAASPKAFARGGKLSSRLAFMLGHVPCGERTPR